MRLLKIRLGFATNSSSTHSVVLLPPSTTVDCDMGENADFGWDFFTAASRTAKSNWLVHLVSNRLSRINPQLAQSVIQQWFPDSTIDMTEEDYGYIDHQSFFSLPSAWDGEGFDPEFVREFRDFILQDNIVICGGNDNDEDVHPLQEGKSLHFHATMGEDDSDRVDLVARKDSRGFWTLFNRKYGTKTRLVIGEDNTITDDKSDAPELVDLKITDYCPFNCSFCYQSSTLKGIHAPPKLLSTIIKDLSQMRVFEVALGGGEPTMYPEFPSLLREIRKHGIVPNFTTKSLKWLKDSEIVDAVRDVVGAFAFSAETADEIKTLASALDFHDLGQKVTIQHVMGSRPSYELWNFVKACKEHRFGVTLLGFKEQGRGTEFKPHPYNNWIKDIREKIGNQYMSIGIDTALAQQSQAELDKVFGDSGKLFYEVKEGTHSMYIDAVERKIGPSSWCGSEKMELLQAKDCGWNYWTVEGIQEAFQKWESPNETK